MEEQVADLEALFCKLKFTKFTLVGYSMGGRIAFSYTIKYPERVASLILRKFITGFEDRRGTSRTKKKQIELLAEKISSGGIAIIR